MYTYLQGIFIVVQEYSFHNKRQRCWFRSEGFEDLGEADTRDEITHNSISEKTIHSDVEILQDMVAQNETAEMVVLIAVSFILYLAELIYFDDMSIKSKPCNSECGLKK